MLAVLVLGHAAAELAASIPTPFIESGAVVVTPGFSRNSAEDVLTTAVKLVLADLTTIHSVREFLAADIDALRDAVGYESMLTVVALLPSTEELEQQPELCQWVVKALHVLIEVPDLVFLMQDGCGSPQEQGAALGLLLGSTTSLAAMAGHLVLYPRRHFVVPLMHSSDGVEPLLSLAPEEWRGTISTSVTVSCGDDAVHKVESATAALNVQKSYLQLVSGSAQLGAVARAGWPVATATFASVYGVATVFQWLLDIISRQAPPANLVQVPPAPNIRPLRLASPAGMAMYT